MPSIPSLQTRHAGFRGRTSSTDYNLNTEEIFFDLASLFETTNTTKAQIQGLRFLYGIENKFLQTQVLNLKNELSRLEQELISLRAGSHIYTAQAFTEDFITLDTTNPAKLDLEFGITTLPISGPLKSKLYIHDELTDTIVIPKTLKTNLDPVADGITTLDYHAEAAFDGQAETYWYREVSYPLSSDIRHAECTVTITLPDDIISTRDCNTITIKTFPVGTIDIMSIQYRLDAGWRTIPGWDSPMLNTSNVKLCFPEIQIAELRIVLRQRYWIQDNHKKTFYIGAQEIGVFHSDYQVKQGQLTATFDLPPGVKTIMGVQPHFTNARALANHGVITFDLYTQDISGSLVSVQNILPTTTNSNKLILRATLRADTNGVTPALERIELRYKLNQ